MILSYFNLTWMFCQKPYYKNTVVWQPVGPAVVNSETLSSALIFLDWELIHSQMLNQGQPFQVPTIRDKWKSSLQPIRDTDVNKYKVMCKESLERWSITHRVGYSGWAFTAGRRGLSIPQTGALYTSSHTPLLRRVQSIFFLTFIFIVKQNPYGLPRWR